LITKEESVFTWSGCWSCRACQRWESYTS